MKEKPVLKLEVLDVKDGSISFIIAEQTRKEAKFLPSGEISITLPSGLKLYSVAFPEIDEANFKLYTQGENFEKNSRILTCSLSFWTTHIEKVPEEYTKIWEKFDNKNQIKPLYGSIQHWKRIHYFAHKMASDPKVQTYNSKDILLNLGESWGAEFCSLCIFNKNECSKCILTEDGCLPCIKPGSSYSRVVDSTSWEMLSSRTLIFITFLERKLKTLDPSYVSPAYAYEKAVKAEKEYKKEPSFPGSKQELREYLKDFSTEDLISFASAVHGVLYTRLRRGR